MSPRLPVVSRKDTIAALERVGYRIARRRGSHVRMRHPEHSSRKPVTVPLHRELRRGLLRAILRDAALSREEFGKLLQH